MSEPAMLLEASAQRNSKVAAEVRPPSIWRQIFSFPVLLASLFAVLVVLTVRNRFNDPDLWYHLKVGEIIWNTHAIPRVDSFSFTAAGHPWVAQEWLTQLTLYGVYHVGGYAGLMLWLCVFASLLIVGAYALCAFYSGNAKVAFLGGLITWLFATIGLGIRPHIMGYLLLVCELLILHLGRSRHPRWFFALPLLFAYWINSHGSFFFGLVVLAVVLFCSFLEVRWGLVRSRRWEKRARNTLTLAFVLSLAALSVNPIGLQLAINPVEVMAKLHVNLTYVSEWLPPQFNNLRGLGLLAVAALVVLVPLVRRTEISLEELLLTGLAFGFAVRHERMLFVFGILVAPIVCRLLADLWDHYEPERDYPVANAILIGVALFVMLRAFPTSGELDRQVANANPVESLAYIKRAGLSGRMMNSYIYGGYLIWAAPEYKVFVDGRGDIFESAGVLTEYLEWLGVETDPRSLLDNYHINFCLLSRDAPVAHVLPLLPGWKLVYSDKVSSVFVRGV
jgi:hypothetical protein